MIVVVTGATRGAGNGIALALGNAKWRLHNTFTDGPKQDGFAQTLGISPEHKLLIPSTRV